MRVIVIGAGVIGLATAWSLQRAGADVTVVDPAPASGATHAAAGMLAPVAETYYREQELGRLCLASAAAYPEFVAALARTLRREVGDVGYRATRTLIVGADAADSGALSDLHDLSVSLGLDSQRLTIREARRLEPLLLPTLSCAFVAERDHQVDPRVLAQALLEALAGAGAELVAARVTAVRHTQTGAGGDHSPVTGVRLADGRELHAEAVVVANGVAAREVEGLGVDLSRSLRPVYGDILRLDTPAHLRGLLTGTVRGLVAGRPVYLVPRADGTVVLGATSREDGSDAVSVGGVHELLRDAIRLVPAVAEFSLREAVARARPGTPDNAPLLGRLPAPGLVAATGTFRNGVLLAPAIAGVVTRLVGLGDPTAATSGDSDTGDTGDTASFALTDAELAAFDPTRFARPTDDSPAAPPATPPLSNPRPASVPDLATAAVPPSARTPSPASDRHLHPIKEHR